MGNKNQIEKKNSIAKNRRYLKSEVESIIIEAINHHVNEENIHVLGFRFSEDYDYDDYFDSIKIHFDVESKISDVYKIFVEVIDEKDNYYKTVVVDGNERAKLMDYLPDLLSYYIEKSFVTFTSTVKCVVAEIAPISTSDKFGTSLTFDCEIIYGI